MWNTIYRCEYCLETVHCFCETDHIPVVQCNTYRHFHFLALCSSVSLKATAAWIHPPLLTTLKCSVKFALPTALHHLVRSSERLWSELAEAGLACSPFQFPLDSNFLNYTCFPITPKSGRGRRPPPLTKSFKLEQIQLSKDIFVVVAFGKLCSKCVFVQNQMGAWSGFFRHWHHLVVEVVQVEDFVVLVCGISSPV